MKKYLLGVCLLFILFITPTYANMAYTLTFNQMQYTPLHPPITYKSIPYISLEDFKEFSYLNYTQNENIINLNFYGTPVELHLDSSYIKINNKPTYLRAPIHVENHIVYLPLVLLDTLNYPYTLDNTNIIFSSSIPYSTTSDPFKDHTLVTSSEYENLNTLIDNYFETSELAADFLSSARKNNQYVIIPFRSSYSKLLKSLRQDFKSSYPIEVAIRQVDLLSKTPTIGKLNVIPITPEIRDEGLRFKLENTTLNSTCLETAFNPSNPTQIDSTKTFDALLMRLLYTYTRNTYGLKDDTHYSPVALINMARSDYMQFNVYSLVDNTPINYEMIISKQINNKHIRYTVDFVKP